MRIIFPNLNSIRFIAALMVLVHHVEQFKQVFSLPNHFYGSIAIIGKLGVILFFVLSGFLITYLLLTEEKETGTIAVKSFYIRRILRIWPLYYLIMILAFFVFPYIDFFHVPGHGQSYWFIKIVFFFLLMPNIIHALGAGVAYANQAWSIGTEEQFYLIWPLLMKHFKNKTRLLFTILFAYLLVKFLAIYFQPHTLAIYTSKIIGLFCIDCMAIGGIFAVFAFEKKQVIQQFFFNRFTQMVVWIATILLIFLGISFGYLHYEMYGILFGIIIYNLAINPKTIVHFNIQLFDYLGKISYGIYMYHPIGIIVSIKVLEKCHWQNNIAIYFSGICSTLLMAHLSYKYFEVKYIKMKSKYSKVLSGDNA